MTQEISEFLNKIAKANPQMKDEEIISQIINQEQKPILQCKHCGKKNGGHYIMCSAWID